MLSCELCRKIKSYYLSKLWIRMKHAAALHGKPICFLTLTSLPPKLVSYILGSANSFIVYSCSRSEFRLSSSLQHASHLCGHGLPANRCLSEGEQTLVSPTSSGLLVNQEVKCAWPALTRGVAGGSKTSMKGRIERKNRWEEVACEMIKEQIKFSSVLCVWIMTQR